MTVQELSEWLKTQPSGNKVMLRDPDTDWYLDLQTEPRYRSDGAPPNATILFAEYP